MWGQSQELSFGHVRLEMPGLRSKWRETLGSGWIYVSLESRGRRHPRMDGMESSENGRDLEGKEGGLKRDENPKLSSRTL